MALDPREGLLEHSEFTGLRNNIGEDSFSLSDLSVALNVDITDAARIRRRAGYGSVVVAGVDRSLWANGSTCLGVGSNSLKLVQPDWSTTTLRTGLTPSRPLSYTAVGERVYWSNGVELGCVDRAVNRSWGMTVPGRPEAVATGGTMVAGQYQFAITYLRNDGQESGACRAGTIELTTQGGIALSAIPVSSDSTVTHKVVYAAPAGGETLYVTGVIDNSATTFVIRETRMGVAPLKTQFLGPPPAGEHVAYHGGYMLVADGNRLYPSEPYSPELFDLRKSIPVPDRITMVSPADDGVWIGTGSEVIWLGGDIPEKWDFKTKTEYGVIPGTAFEADSEAMGDGSQAGTPVVLCATTEGTILALRVGGALENMTQSRFAFPSMDAGAGLVRKHRGGVQYIATLRGTETAGNIA